MLLLFVVPGKGVFIVLLACLTMAWLVDWCFLDSRITRMVIRKVREKGLRKQELAKLETDALELIALGHVRKVMADDRFRPVLAMPRVFERCKYHLTTRIIPALDKVDEACELLELMADHYFYLADQERSQTMINLCLERLMTHLLPSALKTVEDDSSVVEALTESIYPIIQTIQACEGKKYGLVLGDLAYSRYRCWMKELRAASSCLAVPGVEEGFMKYHKLHPAAQQESFSMAVTVVHGHLFTEGKY